MLQERHHKVAPNESHSAHIMDRNRQRVFDHRLQSTYDIVCERVSVDVQVRSHANHVLMYICALLVLIAKDSLVSRASRMTVSDMR